jgi:type I restriction enzyme M protein
MAIDFFELWAPHESNRMGPEYFLFKRAEWLYPRGWVRRAATEVLEKREEEFDPGAAPDLRQASQIRDRDPGKGRNPPEWVTTYFEDSTSTWHRARAGEVVYSSMDLWKDCIAVVPADFDEA